MKYREYIVRYYASHDDIPAGHQDGEIVEELVRCKDCKHHQDEEPGMVYCPKIVGGWIEEECYCSWAERRKR